MKRLFIILGFLIVGASAFSQGFPGTDSLRSYNIKYITNNPATAFVNHRLNTLLAGMIDWIDSARVGEGGIVGVDTIGVLNDSTLRYRKNGVWINKVIKGGVVIHDNSLTGSGTTSSPLKVDSSIYKTVADAQRVTDSLVALLAAKLNISDTAAMLLPFHQKLDSIHLYTATDTNPDTLYQYKGGDSTLVGLIPKGDNWGSQVVQHNATLTGSGTSGDPLKVDTFMMATRLWHKKGIDSLNAALRAIAFLQDGNSFGDTAILGTNDNWALAFETNNVRRAYLVSNGLRIGSGSDGLGFGGISLAGDPSPNNFIVGEGFNLSISGSGTGTGAARIRMVGSNPNAAMYTSGDGRFLELFSIFSPTSGNATYTGLRIRDTINQTGGASGITRGIMIDDVLTSAADYRALELTNNTGLGLYQSGTANNRFNGKVFLGNVVTGNVTDSILVKSPSGEVKKIAPADIATGGGGLVTQLLQPLTVHLGDSASGIPDTLTLRYGYGLMTTASDTTLITDTFNIATRDRLNKVADSIISLAGGGGAVSSVFGRTGAVTAQTNDYTWAQIDKTTSSLADITTRSASDLSSGTLADGRLSSNVPLKNASNTFTNSNTFGTTTINNATLTLTGGTAKINMSDQNHGRERSFYINNNLLNLNVQKSDFSFQTSWSINVEGPANSLNSDATGRWGFAGQTTLDSWLNVPASTTSTAGLKLPHGSAPTSPVNGQVWTTTTGIFARINGVTKQLNDQGGSLSDGDKGDITVSSSGATWTIDNTAVSFSKIQNITTSRLLGRTTASSGSIEELTVGQGLSLSSGSLSGVNAAADGSTKGVAAFNANDFNASSGVITLDYTNGQAASSSNKGFLTSTDWSTFNNKLSNITSLISAGTNVSITGTGTSGDPYVINSSGGGGGSGDVISNETSNTDGQLPLFGTQTDGKHLKKFTSSGLLSSSSGVVTGVTTSAGIASALSDEVGSSSGLLVFNNGPTFQNSITTPSVIGGTGTTSTLTFQTTTGVGASGADIIFKGGNNGATEFARILNNGKFGVKDATPTYDFDVTGKIGINDLQFGYYPAGMTDAGTTIGIGEGALANVTVPGGVRNVGIGYNAMNLLAGGFDNVAIGNKAMDVATTAAANVAIGKDAGGALTIGQTNTFIGVLAGSNVTSGGRNVAIGYNATLPSATASNQLNIGNTIYSTTLESTTPGISLAGVTSSYPGLFRNGAEWEAKLADGSAFTNINVLGETYGVGWDGDNGVPTKNDVYDKIEAISVSNIGNSDLTLTGTRELAGANNSLSLGTSASKLSTAAITSAGLIKLFGGLQISTSNSSDADLAVPAGIGAIRLTTITANRVLTLPDQGSGKLLIIWNENSSANSWSVTMDSGNVILPNGTTVTTLTNDTVYILLSMNGNYVKIN